MASFQLARSFLTWKAEWLVPAHAAIHATVTEGLNWSLAAVRDAG